MNDERELVRRMLAGEEQAFNAFFECYFARVYRFALPRLNGDTDAARDVVQAVLTRAVRKLDQYRGEAAMFTWICQICRREIVDYLRSRRRQTDRVVLIDDQPQLRAAVESIAAPEEYELDRQYGREQTGQLIQTVLDRLPSRYGDALEWKYIDGRSVEEIGTRLGIGHAAAQSLLARARVAFREALETVFGSAAADLANALEA